MKFLLFQLLPVTAIFIAFLNTGVHAQIVPDTSLGNDSSAIGSAQPDTGIQLITGGAARGSSLFHSFEQFSVDAGQKVYFSNPSEVSNIFTRVTGNQVSNISGTLGVLGNANLFFLNPSGIIFTKGASLDLRGSFLATTANSFSFPGGSSAAWRK
jgi:filamentous hemagglutinin family protein